MKILIDTNIVIDALTSREPWSKSAEKIFSPEDFIRFMEQEE